MGILSSPTVLEGEGKGRVDSIVLWYTKVRRRGTKFRTEAADSLPLLEDVMYYIRALCMD
jgi:hypothetical protein